MKTLTIAALSCVLMTSAAHAQVGNCLGSAARVPNAEIIGLNQFAALHNSLEGAKETLTILRRIADQACDRDPIFKRPSTQLENAVIAFVRYAREHCKGGIDNACRAGFVSTMNASWARDDLTNSILAGLKAE
jgi:hypothetical protein